MSLRRSGAFTLVEMLVVMAIVVALAGIIYASLGPAREKARQSVCISNLHQLGKAIAMYRSEYDGADVTGGRQTFGELGLPPTTLSLDPYVRDKGVWHCPDENWEAIMPGMPPGTRWATSYYWHMAPDDLPGPKFSDEVARRGEETVLLACEHHNTLPLPEGQRTEFGIVLRLSGAVQAHNVKRGLQPRDW